jgi:hypothetical protein
VVAGLVAIGACSLALAVGLIVAGPRAAVESSGADSFSRSALGHRAFVDLLRASGVPAVVSRFASGERAGHSSVLVIAEPQLAGDGAREQRLTSMLAAAGTVLLVLPKWTGQGRGREPGWIDGVSPVPAEAVARTLRAAGVSAELSRPRDADAGRCAGAAAGIRWSQPQLLVPRAPSLQARLVCGGGVLFGEMTRPNGQRLFVLSDPDVIANHGLGKGGNAALALEIVERARRRGQPVVVDETLHGHEHVPSLWADLFAFPQLASVIHGGLALLFFIWAGMARFGAPLVRAPRAGLREGHPDREHRRPAPIGRPLRLHARAIRGRVRPRGGAGAPRPGGGRPGAAPPVAGRSGPAARRGRDPDLAGAPRGRRPPRERPVRGRHRPRRHARPSLEGGDDPWS